MKAVLFLIFIFFLISVVLIISGAWVPSWGATLGIFIFNMVSTMVAWISEK